MIRVLIADDHQLIRAGFRQLAADDHLIEVVGEAAEGGELLRRLERTRTDVVILDIGMPGPGFVPLIRELRKRFPRAAVLVVSMHAEGQLAVQALRAGAAGYVSKTQAPNELLAAVKKAHAGGTYVSPAHAERLAVELRSGFAGRAQEALSARECQVLCLLGTRKCHNVSVFSQ